MELTTITSKIRKCDECWEVNVGPVLFLKFLLCRTKPWIYNRQELVLYGTNIQLQNHTMGQRESATGSNLKALTTTPNSFILACERASARACVGAYTCVLSNMVLEDQMTKIDKKGKERRNRQWPSRMTWYACHLSRALTHPNQPKVKFNL